MFEQLQLAKSGFCTHESLGCIECRAMADEDSEESVWSEMKLTGKRGYTAGGGFGGPPDLFTLLRFT